MESIIDDNELERLEKSILFVEKRVGGVQFYDHLDFGSVERNTVKCISDTVCTRVGEFNSNNKLNGRGIEIIANGPIYIGYYIDGRPFPCTNYIRFEKNNRFRLGEYILNHDNRLS